MNEKQEKIGELNKKFTTEALSITINPDKQHYGQGNRWGKVYNDVRKDIFEIMGTDTIYKIYICPDLSAPSPIIGDQKIPRIHWHGVIYLKDPPQFFTRGLSAMNRYVVDIDTIDNMDIWMKYSKKFIDKYPEYKQYVIDEGEEGENQTHNELKPQRVKIKQRK